MGLSINRRSLIVEIDRRQRVLLVATQSLAYLNDLAAQLVRSEEEGGLELTLALDCGPFHGHLDAELNHPCVMHT